MEKLLVNKKEKSIHLNKGESSNANPKKDKLNFLKKVFKKQKENSKNIIDKSSQKKQDEKIKNYKNSQKNIKNNAFFIKIKEKWQYFLIFTLIFILSILSIFLIFLHNEYYDFLNRPKIISSPSSILLLLLLSSVTALCLFFCSNLKNGSCKTDLQPDENRMNFDIVKSDKKQAKINKIFELKSNFQNHLFLINNMLICIAFLLKIIWLCPIFSFTNTVLCAQNFRRYKDKSLIEKLLSVSLILFDICVLSAFYMLFMLN